MVQAVRQMEATPFVCRQWAQHKMIGNRLARREARFAVGDDIIHADQVLQDFLHDLLRGRASWQDPLWRLSSARVKTEPGHRNALPAFRAAAGCSERFALGEAFFQVLDCAEVSEIQMLKDFRGAPLAPGGTARELFNAGSADG